MRTALTRNVGYTRGRVVGQLTLRFNELFQKSVACSYNVNRTQTCRSEEDVRALASTAPERRHVHPARVNNLVMRDSATVLNCIYRYHNALQRAGWQAQRRCVWQLWDVFSAVRCLAYFA